MATRLWDFPNALGCLPAAGGRQEAHPSDKPAPRCNRVVAPGAVLVFKRQPVSRSAVCGTIQFFLVVFTGYCLGPGHRLAGILCHRCRFPGGLVGDVTVYLLMGVVASRRVHPEAARGPQGVLGGQLPAGVALRPRACGGPSPSWFVPSSASPVATWWVMRAVEAAHRCAECHVARALLQTLRALLHHVPWSLQSSFISSVSLYCWATAGRG